MCLVCVMGNAWKFAINLHSLIVFHVSELIAIRRYTYVTCSNFCLKEICVCWGKACLAQNFAVNHFFLSQIPQFTSLFCLVLYYVHLL